MDEGNAIIKSYAAYMLSRDVAVVAIAMKKWQPRASGGYFVHKYIRKGFIYFSLLAFFVIAAFRMNSKQHIF